MRSTSPLPVSLRAGVPWLAVTSHSPPRLRAVAATSARLALGIALLALGAPIASRADEVPAARVILILDASGSMWGQIDGRPKIEIAREVVADMLADWDPSLHLGLTVYGHRRKGDCDDIESLVPVGPVDHGAFLATVRALNPKGKTPMSEAVRRAAAELRSSEERATVILVSDGEETCQADPCKVALELERSGVDFTAHVIGFDVDDPVAQAQLRCLAENTGGQFMLARDAPSLREALGRAVESSRVSLRAPEIVFAGHSFEVEWDGPDRTGDRIAIVPVGSEPTDVTTSVQTAAGRPARLVGPGTSGPHEVRYVSGGKVLLALEVTVRGALASVTGPATVEAGAWFDVTWTGPAAEGDIIALVSAETSDDRFFRGEFSASTADGSPARLKAFGETGPHELRYAATRGARVLARQPIEIVAAGARVTAPAEVEAGAEFEVSWSGPGNDDDSIAIVPAGHPDQRVFRGDFSRSPSTGNPIRLAAFTEAGPHEVRYVTGADGVVLARQAVAITPSSARVDVPESVEAGAEFRVAWSGPSRDGDRIVLVRSGAPEGRYWREDDFTQAPTDGNPVTLTAFSEPGDCEVRYQAQADGKTLARAALRVLASTARLEAPATVVAGTEFEVAWTGPNSDGDRIIMVRADTPEGSSFRNRELWHATSAGSPARLTAFPEAGRYEVRYMAEADGKTLASAPVTVTAAP